MEIVVSTREHEVNDQALEIVAAGESNLYERAGVLVQIVRPSVSGGNSNAMVVRPIQEARLGEVLTKHCVFMAPRQVKEALIGLREVVCDFPFRDDSHFAAWLSSLLTPLARAAFEGPSPLNLIDANVRGSGKSLLADVCSTLLTGRPAARMSYSRDEDELRKAITGLALEATQLVLIDNISGKFGSPTLDRALTADTWRDRLLGGNEQVSVPLRVSWYATGNNVVLTGDTPRRCLHVRLESPLERPEQRTNFRHPRLLSWPPLALPSASSTLGSYPWRPYGLLKPLAFGESSCYSPHSGFKYGPAALGSWVTFNQAVPADLFAAWASLASGLHASDGGSCTHSTPLNGKDVERQRRSAAKNREI